MANSGTDSVHQVFAHLDQAALVTTPWHLPSAPEILCAKTKLPRKLHAEGRNPSYCFGYLEALLTKGPFAPSKSRRSLKPFLDKQREGVRVFAGGRGMRPRTIFHCTANFPTQLEGHQGLSCLICSWQTQELFYTWVSTPEPSSSEWMSCSQPSRSPA